MPKHTISQIHDQSDGFTITFLIEGQKAYKTVTFEARPPEIEQMEYATECVKDYIENL